MHFSSLRYLLKRRTVITHLKSLKIELVCVEHGACHEGGGKEWERLARHTSFSMRRASAMVVHLCDQQSFTSHAKFTPSALSYAPSPFTAFSFFPRSFLASKPTTTRFSRYPFCKLAKDDGIRCNIMQQLLLDTAKQPIKEISNHFADSYETSDEKAVTNISIFDSVHIRGANNATKSMHCFRPVKLTDIWIAISTCVPVVWNIEHENFFSLQKCVSLNMFTILKFGQPWNFTVIIFEL